MIVLSSPIPDPRARGADGVPEPIVETAGAPVVRMDPSRSPAYPAWYPLVDTNEHEVP